MLQIENFSDDLLESLKDSTINMYSIDASIPYIVVLGEDENPKASARLYRRNNTWQWEIDNSNLMDVLENGEEIEDISTFNTIISEFKEARRDLLLRNDI